MLNLSQQEKRMLARLIEHYGLDASGDTIAAAAYGYDLDDESVQRIVGGYFRVAAHPRGWLGVFGEGSDRF